jgi:hypothetical protein
MTNLFLYQGKKGNYMKIKSARAIAALGGELTGMQTNVDRLVREIESAVAQADEFIQSLQAE